MTATTLIFRTSEHLRGGEQDFVEALQNTVMTPELALAYALPVLQSSDHCRIGVLVLDNGIAKLHPGWRAKRYARFEDMPKGAFFEMVPGVVRDIVDDMDVSINLAPWVAVVSE